MQPALREDDENSGIARARVCAAVKHEISQPANNETTDEVHQRHAFQRRFAENIRERIVRKQSRTVD